MIKREYFIQMVRQKEPGSLGHMYRQFSVTGWFPADPQKLINEVVKQVAVDQDCTPDEIIVKAFNRC